MKGTIRLVDKQEREAKGKWKGLNKTFVEIFSDIFFQNLELSF